MEQEYKKALAVLESFHQNRVDGGEDDQKQGRLYFDWIEKKTNLIESEKAFQIPEGIEIKRGSVFWIEFGFNVGEEFGGRHPGIILKKGNHTVIALPISTQQPTEEQLQSGIYVPIDRVYRFKPPRDQQWVNILNAMPVSVQRIDFDSTIGYVKGPTLDKIKEAMKSTGLWHDKVKTTSKTTVDSTAKTVVKSNT